MRSQLKKKNARTAKHRTKLGVVRFARVRLKPPALGSMKTSEKFKKKPNPSSQTKGLGLARIYACENKAACAWRVEKNFKKNDSVLQSISYQCKCRIWGVGKNTIGEKQIETGNQPRNK